MVGNIALPQLPVQPPALAPIEPKLPYGFVKEDDLAPIPPEGFDLVKPAFKMPDFNAPIPPEGFTLTTPTDTPPVDTPLPTPSGSDIQGIGDMKPPVGGMPGLGDMKPPEGDITSPTPPKGFIPIRHGVMGPEPIGADMEQINEEQKAKAQKDRQYREWYDSLSNEDKAKLQHEENIRRWETMEKHRKTGILATYVGAEPTEEGAFDPLFDPGKTRKEISDEGARITANFFDKTLDYDREKSAAMMGIIKKYPGKSITQLLVEDNPEAVKWDDKYGSRFGLKSYPLTEVLNHPSLFKAYPDLKNVNVKFIENEHEGGHYNPKTNTINVSQNAALSKQEDTLLHEIQHAIQEKEGWARGGNLGSIHDEDRVKQQELKSQKREIDKILQPLLNTPERFKGKQKQISELIGKIRKIDTQLSIIERKIVFQDDAFNYYQRLAGEIEARDTAARKGLTAEQRRAQAPYAGQKIPLKDIIVKRDGGKAMSEIPAEEGSATGRKGVPEFQRLLELQRKAEGWIAAIKDPKTGKVYSGYSHKSAINSVPKGDDAWGRLEVEWDRATDNVGFLDKNGDFISRDTADKMLSIKTMEDRKDLLEGKNLVRLFHNWEDSELIDKEQLSKLSPKESVKGEGGKVTPAEEWIKANPQGTVEEYIKSRIKPRDEKRRVIQEWKQSSGYKEVDSSFKRGAEDESIHAPASPESGSPLYSLTEKGIYPDDVYSMNGRRYYGTGEDRMDNLAYNIISEAEGNPNKEVKIYRAIEKDGASKINPGDWVTTVRGYATEHGRGNIKGEFKILSKTVKAKDIFTSGDSWLEWGYHPQPEIPRSVYVVDKVKAKSEYEHAKLSPKEGKKIGLKDIQASILKKRGE